MTVFGTDPARDNPVELRMSNAHQLVRNACLNDSRLIYVQISFQTIYKMFSYQCGSKYPNHFAESCSELSVPRSESDFLPQIRSRIRILLGGLNIKCSVADPVANPKDPHHFAGSGYRSRS